MKLIEIKDREKINNFVSSQEQSQFLESWEWGEFNKGIGFRVKRVGVEEKGELVGTAVLIEKRLPLGMKYWYCPRGPVIRGSQNVDRILIFLFEELKRKSKFEKIIFLRFEPRSTINDPRAKKTIDVQPSKTLILDLTRSEEEILKDMHQKTRYNIRLAGKKGVEVVEASQDEFDEWWKIMEETRTRDQFRLHSKDYYYNQLGITRLNPAKRANYELKIKLIIAKYKGEIIAGNIVAFFGDTATYVHGASSNKFRNIMAPYALQWHCIKQAKELGYKYYDFNGIDENKWPGVTRFKKGFGGEEINYPGTFDLVFSKVWYFIYKVIRKLRRMV